MLIVSPATASALASHAAERSWVIFVQVNPPIGGNGPIKIEGIRGSQLAARLSQLARDNAFDAMLIGMIETTTPAEYATAIAEQYAGIDLHDGWFEPTADLLALIQHAGQSAIQALLAQTHPGGLSEAPVDIENMARILDVSIPTVRRMVKAEQIPYLRWGRMLRFVPTDVIATLQRAR